MREPEDRDFRFSGTRIGLQTGIGLCGSGMVEHEESDMISEIQVHVIARQMFEKRGLEAIA